MKKVTDIFCLAIVLSLLAACRHALKEKEYARYVKTPDNGLIKTLNTGDWEYTIQYKPYDYIILLENQGKANAAIVNKRRRELKGTAWFNVSFKTKEGMVSPLRYNISSKEDYDSRLNYFLNEAMRNLKLVYDHKDTLPQIGYLFENNYNLTPHETMLVGFALPRDVESPQKDMQLSYNDVLFKNGIVKVIYRSADLKNIPNLIY